MPKCDAYEFGQVHFQPDKTDMINNNHMKDQELKKHYIMPVHMLYLHNYT